MPRTVTADSFLLPELGRNSIIGAVGHTAANEQDTLADIARRFDLGYDEIVKANPTVNRWVPGSGTRVIIPNQFILPDAPREGIVLNLAELRLYYFPPSDGGQARRVFTYPISIGRMDWKSPLGVTRIASKERDPAWYPPPSIKAEHAAEGDYLPDVIPGGVPNNPLGHYALKLALPRYLIHGTDERKEYGIGMRVTHGCIRMYPEDIEELFSIVPVNTPVRLIDQPVKAGWRGPELLLEVHTPLEEDEEEFEEYSHRVDMEEVMALLDAVGADSTTIDIAAARRIVWRGDGVPTVIGRTESLLPPARNR